MRRSKRIPPQIAAMKASLRLTIEIQTLIYLYFSQRQRMAVARDLTTKPAPWVKNLYQLRLSKKRRMRSQRAQRYTSKAKDSKKHLKKFKILLSIFPETALIRALKETRHLRASLIYRQTLIFQSFKKMAAIRVSASQKRNFLLRTTLQTFRTQQFN